MVWAELLIWTREGLCVCVLKHLFKFRHIKHFSAQWLQREMPHTSAHLTQFFHHISFNTVLSINTLFAFSKYRFLFIARKPCNLCYCLKPRVLLWNGITFFLIAEELLASTEVWNQVLHVCRRKRDLVLLQYLPFSVFPSPGITSTKPNCPGTHCVSQLSHTTFRNFHLKSSFHTKTKSSF